MSEKIKHIAFDLELEQPNGFQVTDSSISEPKIIQIGWIVYTCNPFTIIQRRLYNINIGVPISTFIRNLTGITNKEIESGVSLEYAYLKLVEDLKQFGCSRILKQWGGGDDLHLKKEVSCISDIALFEKEIPWLFGRSAQNVKHLYHSYAEINSLKLNGGLKKSMARCNLKFDGAAHNALTDAINTAVFHEFLISSMNKKTNKQFC